MSADAEAMEKAASVVIALEAAVHALRDGEPQAALESAQYALSNIIPFFRTCVFAYACAMLVAGRDQQQVKRLIDFACEADEEALLRYASRMVEAHIKRKEGAG